MRNCISLTVILSLFLCTASYAQKNSPAAEQEPAMTSPQACTLALSPRILKPLEILKGFFNKGLTMEETLEKIKAGDARYYVFQLEGLMRLYGGFLGKKAKNLRWELKYLEDAIGAYTEKAEYIEDAVKLNPPATIKSVLQDMQYESKAALETFLTSNGWFSEGKGTPRKFEEIEAVLTKLTVDPEKEETIAILEEMIAEMKEVETYEMDVTQLQDGKTDDRPGVHKQRRNWRWFLIYMQALDGMILLEPAKLPLDLNEYSYLHTHALATNRFSVIQKNSYSKVTVKFPQHLYLAMSKIINELGAVKEHGELEEVLAQAYLRGYEDAGLVKDEKHAKKLARELVQTDPSYSNFQDDAQKIQDEMDRTQLVKKMRKALEASLKELKKADSEE